LRDFPDRVINSATPRTRLVNLAAQANSGGIIFWKFCEVAALRAHASFENACVTRRAKFVAFMNAPNFGDIFAAFIAHLSFKNWLSHLFAMASFRFNRAIMRFT
jgi:hypothetical protein